jgi:putative NADH-flavin reductase
MTIAVLGATGRTGRPLVEELLRRGHAVTALVRDPARLGPLGERVTVVTGSSTDAGALDNLLDGAEAVVSALGPTSRDSTLQSDTARALVPAMGRHGVARFVGVSGTGVDVPGDRKSRRHQAISWMVRRLGGAMATDKSTEYEVFAASDLDWTLVRPPRLLDGPATGRVLHDARTPGRSSSIRRADLAVFLADVLDEHLYPRQAPFVSQA